MEDQIHCPKCGSTQITANKNGFSGQKAVAGAILTGGIGLLAGTIGSKNILITCLSCGKKFKPGEGKNENGKTYQQQKIADNNANFKELTAARDKKLQTDPGANKRAITNSITFILFFFLGCLILFACELYFLGALSLFIAILFIFQYAKVKRFKKEMAQHSIID